MPIKVTCSNCGGVLHAPDDAGGKRGRCPTCGNILPIPAAGGADLPEPPAAAVGQRPPSFADFALGPKVGPPPGGTEGSRSSIPFNTGAANPAPPQRAKAPPEAAEDRRASGPFTRKGPTPIPAAAAPPAEGAANAWKKSRGGLGLVQMANFLLFIPAVLLPAFYLAQTFKPDLIPGLDADFPGVKGLDVRTAVPLLAVGAPLLLALLLNVFGRLGFAGAPKRSAVGGPAFLSALAALLALCGVLAVIAPNVVAVIQGDPLFPLPGNPLFEAASAPGLCQRLGLFVGATAVVVGEFWFASAVGRVGSALTDSRSAARSTRYLMLLGLAMIGLVGTGALIPGPQFGLSAPVYEGKTGAEEFPRFEARKKVADNPAYEVGRETNELVAGQWERFVPPLFDQAGTFKPMIPPAVCLLVGLMVWAMHVRLVRAARGAMAGWLDAHGGTA